MDAELKQYLEEMKAELKAHTDAAEQRMTAHTEHTETKLLTEFWKWGKAPRICEQGWL